MFLAYTVSIIPVIHQVNDEAEKNDLEQNIFSVFMEKEFLIIERLKAALVKEQIEFTNVSLHKKRFITIDIQCSEDKENTINEIVSSVFKTIETKLRLIGEQRIELKIQTTKERYVNLPPFKCTHTFGPLDLMN